MAIDINIPSQVKTYANLAAFPASGSLKTIYIAEDTNKTYRWTGSVYVEISASAASGLTVGTTPIASGTVGRVLFQGTGNVLQQSANIFWDDTNVRIGIGTSTPAQKIDVLGNVNGGNLVNIKNASTGAAAVSGFQCENSISNGSVFLTSSSYTPNGVLTANTLGFYSGGVTPITICSANIITMSTGGVTERLRIGNTGNVLIGITTDAGFRLDVNGTARVSGNTVVTTWIGVGGVTTPSGTGEKFNVQGAQVISGSGGAGNFLLYQISGASRFIVGSEASIGGTANNYINYVYGNNSHITYTNNVARLSVTGGGNVLINTTTDAGFRLDVNGTARVSDNFSLGSGTGAFDIDLNKSKGSGVWGSIRNTLASSYSAINLGTNASASKLTIYSFGSSYSSTGQYQANKSLLEVVGDLFVTASNFIFYSGSVGVGTTTPNASALMDIASTTKGFLPPRMTTTQKNAIATPATGLQVYDTTLNQMSYYNGTTWTNI